VLPRLALGSHRHHERQGSAAGPAAQYRLHSRGRSRLDGPGLLWQRRGDRVKLLYWDEDGFVIVYKRLEDGVFRWPTVAVGQPSVSLRATELAMLLDGIDWSKAQRSRRYHRPATAMG